MLHKIAQVYILLPSFHYHIFSRFNNFYVGNKPNSRYIIIYAYLNFYKKKT